MRTFIYGLEDVDRGADALKQAQRLGYTAGDRETVQLADGYRARGDTFARTARTLAGTARNRSTSRDRPRPIGRRSTCMRRCSGSPRCRATCGRSQRGLEQVEQRMTDLTQSPTHPVSPLAEIPMARRSPIDASPSDAVHAMGLTYTTAAQRDVQRRDNSIRAERFQPARLSLAVTSGVALLAITLAYLGRISLFEQSERARAGVRARQPEHRRRFRTARAGAGDGFCERERPAVGGGGAVRGSWSRSGTRDAR